MKNTLTNSEINSDKDKPLPLTEKVASMMRYKDRLQF